MIQTTMNFTDDSSSVPATVVHATSSASADRLVRAARRARGKGEAKAVRNAPAQPVTDGCKDVLNVDAAEVRKMVEDGSADEAVDRLIDLAASVAASEQPEQVPTVNGVVRFIAIAPGDPVIAEPPFSIAMDHLAATKEAKR